MYGVSTNRSRFGDEKDRVSPALLFFESFEELLASGRDVTALRGWMWLQACIIFFILFFLEREP